MTSNIASTANTTDANDATTAAATVFKCRLNAAFQRPILQTLQQRLQETPRRMIVVAGPRQIGKSTLVSQALDGKFASFIATDQPDDGRSFEDASESPFGEGFADPFGNLSDPFAPGDENTPLTPNPIAAKELRARSSATTRQASAPNDGQWLIDHWQKAREIARNVPAGQFHILAIDEIQKIPRWSEIVKGLWDQDRRNNLPLHIILLGSSPWLIQKGLTESLAGRYEPIFMSHWSYPEMREAFGFTLDQYIYFGGYPEPATTLADEDRWKRYVLTTLIQATIEQDILQMTRIEKPTILKRLFELGCGTYSGQILALHKIAQDIDGAAHLMTLRHYLDLLSQAKLLTGLQKFAREDVRRRASPPKFNTHNTALVCAQLTTTLTHARQDPELWGHLVESAVGAHLINDLPMNCGLYYWREEPHEVDFLLVAGRKIVAIEVKSSPRFKKPKGLEIFKAKFERNYSIRTLLIGPDLPETSEGQSLTTSLENFLSQPVQHWINGSGTAGPDQTT